MVRIAVAGAAGRMGGRVIHTIASQDNAELAGAFEAPGNPAVGRPIAEVAGLPGATGLVGDNPAEAIAQADVLIDFTAPAATLKNLALAAESGKAMVIGTTGLDAAQQEELKKQAAKTPVMFAPNMSVGMNLMFKLVGMMAEVLGEGYALELVEAHHDQKKDAPSGTAVKLIAELARVRGWDAEEVCRHGRQGMVGARGKDEIGVSVIRGGDIVGDHTVYFIGQGERLELTHRAHSRDTFAQGAVRAALWVAGKAPGLYDMQDVLGLKG
jgi:4-hydroxy-tetrahydrodipicolinate reductase